MAQLLTRKYDRLIEEVFWNIGEKQRIDFNWGCSVKFTLKEKAIDCVAS